ncbi:hypothetical protein C474_12551 [Halogeometricum pallidum JCM 14848]|uniref:DUF309 domain-containing protein n=1 Tax=Halogeometricum pallidum JCM 14848 TaxID=1227487 RepID=M0D340_HALPD|nr:DUF309 domain-containing protein [Halogeometricum pallidum]ELZ29865.1 hypothetical protein C474_12551 [Halogeometricum pallidum JCM 14848]
MEGALRVGAAVFNGGDHHAAHDAWEDEWLPLDEGTADERLLHGLIQYTAAVYHARTRNWSGARGLAESASGYLGEVASDYREVNVGEVRAYLDRLAADPEFAERASPVPLTVGGVAVRAEDLSFEEAVAAARLLAEDGERWDESVVDDAARYGREEVESGASTTRFVALLFEFVGGGERRGLVYQRLREHAERRRGREADVSGLFE